MNVGELLYELRHNILHDRTNQVSGTSDQLWSDATLVRYIDEAQRRLARLGFVIRDHRTPDTCRLTTVPGQQEYELHPAVLAVMSARVEGATSDLLRLGHASIGGYLIEGVDPAQGQHIVGMQPGHALAFQTDEGFAEDDEGSVGVTTLRVIPEPQEAQTLQLRVVREPIFRLEATQLTAVPEVPEHHHLEMLDWAAYLALRIVDLDAGSPRRAQEFAEQFGQTVALARRTAMRKLRSPRGWGFGQFGFSWER